MSLFPITGYTRGGLYTQAIVIVVAYGVWKVFSADYIAPGDAIGALGGVAALMTIRSVRREHFTKVEQFFWVLIAFAFFIGETTIIHRDRDQHDTQQRIEATRQADQFSATLGSFRDLHEQNKVELAKTDSVVGKLNMSLKKEGDVFEQTRPTASMVLRNTILDLPNQSLFRPGVPFTFRLFDENSGNDTAKNVWRFARIYVGELDQNLAEKTIVARFEKDWQEHTAITRAAIVVPAKAIPTFLDYTQSGITLPELDSLRRKSGEIYVLYRIQFTDNTGTWIADICDRSDNIWAATQSAGTVPLVTRHCSFFNNPRHKTNPQ